MRRRCALLAALMLAPAVAYAQAPAPPDEVDRIPQTPPQVPAPAAGATAGDQHFLEATISGLTFRGGLPPLSTNGPDWQSRLSLNLTTQRDAGPDLQIAFSDRLSLIAQDQRDVTLDNLVQNDLRELYVTWRSSPQQVVQVGRINVRDGIALGYSPTDFFRTGTAVTETSADPAAAREGRLGVAMARYQVFWTGGSMSLAFAPKLGDTPGPNAALHALDPAFQSTNAANRLMLTANFSAVALAPQATLLMSDGETRLGLSVSRLLGSGVVVYGEWVGGVRPNLVRETVDQTPASQTPLALAALGRRSFLNDVVLGGSWSNAATKLTLNAEYHFHQGGLGEREWRAYFDIAANPASPALPFLANLRHVANFEQDPLARHELFVLATRQDAGLVNLTLGALMVSDLDDGSAGGQVWASYGLSSAWSLGAYVSAAGGRQRSEYGSLPNGLTGTLQLVRYF